MLQQDLIVAEANTIQKREPETNILDVIARAASDPSVDVAKMEQLLQMQERILAVTARQQFFAALARIQPKMPRVLKSGEIAFGGKVQSRYARYEDVDEAIRPLLADEGFSISFDTSDEKGLKVTLAVAHSLGHVERRTMTLPLDKSGSKNEVQSIGSTMSYAKRYLVCGFFNIVTVDQDNDGRGEPITLEQQNKIEDLLLHTGSDRRKFLAWLGAPEVPHIQRQDYERAILALDKKAKNDRA